MHEKCFKINFFAKIQKLQKNLLFTGKSLVGVWESSRAIVKDVKIKSKSLVRKKISLSNAVTGCSQPNLSTQNG